MIETSTDHELKMKCSAFQKKMVRLGRKHDVGATVFINSCLSLAFRNIYEYLESEEGTREAVIMSLESFLRQMAEIEEEDESIL